LAVSRFWPGRRQDVEGAGRGGGFHLHFAKACGLVYQTLSAGRLFQLQVFPAAERTGRKDAGLADRPLQGT
jgi:hypothetical protein